MDEKLVLNESKINFFQVFDLMNKLEQAHKPEIEKISLLIEYARDFYGQLDFETGHEKLMAWSWDEQTQTWQHEKMDVDTILEMAQKAFDNFQEKKSLQNIEVCMNYYEKKYKQIVSIYKPFYDYVFKLLEKIKSSLDYIKAGKQTELKVKELEQTVAEQEKDNSYLKEKMKKIENSLTETAKDMEAQTKFIKNYSDWVKLLVDRTMFSREDDIRVVLYLLVRGELDKAEISTKLRIPLKSAESSLNNLIARGVVIERKIGKTKNFSLFQDYISQVVEKKRQDDSRVEKMLSKVAKFKQDTEQEKSEPEKNSNLEESLFDDGQDVSDRVQNGK